MPYRDEEKQRQYKREWQRANRGGTRHNPVEPGGTRLQSPDEVLAVLEEQIETLRRDRRLRSVERAKAIAQLAALTLKALEHRDMERKVDDIESAVRMREPVTRLTRRRVA